MADCVVEAVLCYLAQEHICREAGRYYEVAGIAEGGEDMRMTMHLFFPNPSKVYGGNIHYQGVIVIGHVPNTFRGTPPLQALRTF